MGAYAAVAGQNQGLMGERVVKEMVVVQGPERIKPFHGGFASLLPVDPPEINAVLFIGPVEHVKISVDIAVVGDIEGDLLLGCGIHSHGLCHFLIGILEIAHAVRRMEIQGHFQVLFVELSEKTFIVREKIRVPAVAGPAVIPAVQLIVFAVP